MGVTDLQVLQAFKKGQLELFYRRIYPGLLLYAVKNAGDRHDFLAEDCVQNAIFNAWKRRDSFDSIYTLKSFLYTSVKMRSSAFTGKEKHRNDILPSWKMKHFLPIRLSTRRHSCCCSMLFTACRIGNVRFLN